MRRRWLLVGWLLMTVLAGDTRVHAARRKAKKPGKRDQQRCAVGERGWQIAPRSRFEEDAPPCQFDKLTLAEANNIFVEHYEGKKPVVVTGATAVLPQDAFSRCDLDTVSG